ncbi:DUF1249 domain-containing protein [Gallaecimonas kandeliae]|uniref:DUF1249 domain-containing protein n=1 Tax=Gallaecimonas kandeliae TaxID=3029055 RepID=UPI002649EAC7|nr:DUF1249 domain-containing protein [Gallaecimonas kandeliae]WKE64741.1 DUF1249 domain-containing protein [Gallaecimonas kandeliae]
MKKRYRPSLKALHTTCEQNYAALMKLSRRLGSVGDHISYLVGRGQRYCLRLTEDFPYTSTITIEQQGALPPYLKAMMQVRLYHDVRMAEVCASQHFSRLAPRYAYPNDKMLLPDEKMQVNLFLTDWLKLCLTEGRCSSDMLGSLL